MRILSLAQGTDEIQNPVSKNSSWPPDIRATSGEKVGSLGGSLFDLTPGRGPAEKLPVVEVRMSPGLIGTNLG